MTKKLLAGKCPVPPKRDRRVKGHNINEISFPGSPALWAGSFTYLYGFNRFFYDLCFGERSKIRRSLCNL